MFIYRTLNPATGELLKKYEDATWSQVEEALQKAERAFRNWRKVPLNEKSVLFQKLASLIRQKKESLALLITEEMGKPVAQAEVEIDKCARGCEYYATHAEAFLRPEIVKTDAVKSYVRYDPLGTILGIMPWNFPFWQVFRFGIPALISGNVVLLKHAPNVPGCALKILSLFQEAGFPADVFQNLFLSHSDAEKVIRSGRIQGVSLTGSDRAGRQVAAIAGGSLVKSVLELGGSDPFIVLEDADLEKVIPVAIRSRMLNTGQSCIAAKRILIPKKIFPRFESLFVSAVRALKVGDPLQKETDIGPLAREDLLDQLIRQVKETVDQGGQIVVGGERLETRGFFYKPTVLEGVTSDMTAFRQEIFGPVAALIEVRNEEEALHLANQTSFGLGASLWTQDIARAEKLAEEIEAGSVFINGMVKSDPRLPFGGIKNSGYGRELSSQGLREFVNVKTVWVA